MIKLKLESGEEHIVVPTVFPDGTSQVWKLPENFYGAPAIHIVWYFESEAEFMQLIQIQYLLDYSHAGIIKTLFIPFLPYGRQDKKISNDNTFALRPFFDFLTGNYRNTLITTLDAHNKEPIKNCIDSRSPAKYILKSLIHSQADLVCYPDAGAKDRYNHLVPMDNVVADKVRDQSTGQITGHKLIDTGKVSSQDMIQGKTVLIVDDICDGGRTFTSMAKMLLESGAKNVDLYVTHGIFSQGYDVLKKAGIRNVYTTNSIIGNAKYPVNIYKVE